MPDKNLSGEFVLSEQKPDTQIPQTQTTTPQPALADTTPTNQHPHKHNNPHFFSAFSHLPKGVRFKNQESDEEVIILARQHFITNVPWIAGVILFALLPPVVFLLAPFFLPPLSILPILVTLSTAFYYVALSSLALLYFSMWYFNVGIVTNKRIIDIDVHNILTRVLSEARLSSIQDVTVTQVGGIRSIFNYGNIDIQTEARIQTLEFYRVPQPNFIRTVIGNLIIHRK